MSQLNVDSIKDRTGADQPDIVGAAKAFVNFDGTGTVTIRNGFNVSSITDNGAGDYTVNFTNALEDVNYSVSGTAQYDHAGSVNVADLVGIAIRRTASALSTGSLNIQTKRADIGSLIDPITTMVSIFR